MGGRLTSEKKCNSKMAYKTKKDAKISLNILKQKHREDKYGLEIYQCNNCGLWHISNHLKPLDHVFEKIKTTTKEKE